MSALVVPFDRQRETTFLRLYAGEGERNAFGDISLDIKEKKLVNCVSSICLTKSEFCIMWLLVRAQGGIISEDDIVFFLYEEMEDKEIPLHNSTEVVLSRLKRKLSSVSSNVYLLKERGYGYYIAQNNKTA